MRGTSPIRSNESKDVDPTSRTKYCIRGYCEDAQEYYSPEECDKGKQVVSSSRGLENEHSGSKLHASTKVFQSSMPPKKCGPGGSSILEHRSPNAVNESQMIPMTHPCDPALDPSWKGSFDILDALDFAPGMFNNFIHAHPPSRVRRKVYEFSRLLPGTLKFELVPCGDNWASLFNNNCLGEEDIGLYCFASERASSASSLCIYPKRERVAQ
ncbi:putative dnaJ -like protein subfamily C member 21-like [Capsicum annuum]|nr:putative dnaJ -like protein subfamily C member 21-like [Capsicum annuum]